MPPILETWSIQRLPFEPKVGDWRFDFRGTIRDGANGLHSKLGQVLHAVYGSRSTNFCDAENILFYNERSSCPTEKGGARQALCSRLASYEQPKPRVGS